ncbi:MAG: hypothetical protein ABI268_01775 [Rhodanobacter sp.]
MLARNEEIIQGKHGPSIFQAYRDVWKLISKDEVVSEQGTKLFRFAPLVQFVTPMILRMLISALTAYPLSFGFQST